MPSWFSKKEAPKLPEPILVAPAPAPKFRPRPKCELCQCWITEEVTTEDDIVMQRIHMICNPCYLHRVIPAREEIWRDHPNMEHTEVVKRVLAKLKN